MLAYPATVLIAIGAVVAALIAAAVAFVGLVVSKEQKVSEFRQAWIDSLRKDLSRFIALLQAVRNDETTIELNEKYNRIVLRLNPRKDADLRARVDDAHRAYSAVDMNRLAASTTNLRSDFQELFKTEWERVKAGELVYRTTKWVPLALVIVVLVIVWAMLMGNLPFEVGSN